MATNVKNANMARSKYYTPLRYQGTYVNKKTFIGQCTEKIYTREGIVQCPYEGLYKRDGMCKKCFEWNLRRQNIYPHKDNDNRCVEVYLVL